MQESGFLTRRSIIYFIMFRFLKMSVDVRTCICSAQSEDLDNSGFCSAQSENSYFGGQSENSFIARFNSRTVRAQSGNSHFAQVQCRNRTNSHFALNIYMVTSALPGTCKGRWPRFKRVIYNMFTREY